MNSFEGSRLGPTKSLLEVLNRGNLLPTWVELPKLVSTSADSAWLRPDLKHVDRALTSLVRTMESLRHYSPLDKVDRIKAKIGRIVEADPVKDKKTKASNSRVEEYFAERFDEFATYIWGDHRFEIDPIFYNRDFLADSWQEIRQSIMRYEQLASLRFNLEVFIDWSERHPSWIAQFSPNRISNPTKQMKVSMIKSREVVRDRLASEIPLRGTLHFSVSMDGRISGTYDELSRVLMGEVGQSPIDFRRIRRCQYCEDFFWATRVDKFCCSDSCNGARNEELRTDIGTEERRKSWKIRKARSRLAQRELQESKDRARLREIRNRD